MQQTLNLILQHDYGHGDSNLQFQRTERFIFSNKTVEIPLDTLRSISQTQLHSLNTDTNRIWRDFYNYTILASEKYQNYKI